MRLEFPVRNIVAPVFPLGYPARMKILVGYKRFAGYHAHVQVTPGVCASTDRAWPADRPFDNPARGTMHALPDREVRLARLSGTTDETGVAP